MAKLITYDLNHEKTRPPILEKIKELGGWAKLSESCYAVDTNLTVEQIYARLQPLIDENDNLYIITLAKPYSGFGPKDVNDWLNQNL